MCYNDIMSYKRNTTTIRIKIDNYLTIKEQAGKQAISSVVLLDKIIEDYIRHQQVIPKTFNIIELVEEIRRLRADNKNWDEIKRIVKA